MSQSEIPRAVDRPHRVAIARYFSENFGSVNNFEGDVGNFERHQLQQVSVFLNIEPPDLLRAYLAANKGVAHAWRGDFNESRPEAWACAAVVELLSGEGDRD